MSRSWGCFKSSVLWSSVPCFEKYRVQRVVIAVGCTNTQTNRHLFAQQLSRAASAVVCAQAGLRCSSSPPRLICSQLGRNQRCTAWSCSAASSWVQQKGIETTPSKRASECPAAFSSMLDNAQESGTRQRRRGSITPMQA